METLPYDVLKNEVRRLEAAYKHGLWEVFKRACKEYQAEHISRKEWEELGLDITGRCKEAKIGD
jgi:hypothetical protein